jgi:hypothetical protein
MVHPPKLQASKRQVLKLLVSKPLKLRIKHSQHFASVSPTACKHGCNRTSGFPADFPAGDTSGVTHHPGRLYLPACTSEFQTKRFERPGRTVFPGSIPPLSESAEAALLSTLHHSDTVTEGGWILNTSSVSTVLPQIEAYCLTLPPEAQ